jgi:NADPH-dependent 2,4-dienoyl-CoA reductase/sulfur reductase-like enzyme/ferredoxin
MSVAYLRLRTDGGSGETLSFSDELMLGRDTFRQMGHTDARLSRRHARVFLKDDGQLWVEDLGSTNGTFVNGRRISKAHKVRLGDEITVGRTALEVVAAAGEDLTVQESMPVARQRRRERRERGPSLASRWRENRRTRAGLGPFPNYTQIPSMLSVRAWWVVRYTGALATLIVVVLCFVDSKTGLRIVWGIGIPLLPILFFVAPGLWRNICPLAASNQTPRIMGWTRGLTAPEWLKRYGYLISITLFVVFITLRKVGLQTNGPGSGGLLLLALLSGFTGGMMFKGKSGWCSSICPLLPVQRIYGQTPFALVGNSHCQPCVGCTKNCYDFNPKVAYLADLNDQDPEWSAGRKAFVGAFPGLILGFFKVADVPAISVGAMYGQLALYAGVSVLAFVAADAFLPVSSHKLTTIWAAAALNIFYWFAFPVIYKAITNHPAPSAATWAARVVVFALTGFWIVRTYLKERAFVEKAGASPKPVAGAGAQSIVSHSRANLGKPEIKFLPDDKRIIADPGVTLLELAESNGLQIEAGCRMGVCGADPVAIVSGMENLSEITDDERATLERLGKAANTRMACCCRVKGPAAVSLTPEEPQELTPSQLLRLDFDRSVERVVVIGNGIAGITAADYVRRNHPECSIDVVSDETHHLYNRMAITRLIYGRSAMQGLYLNPDTWSESHSITEWLNTRAQSIDRDAGKVTLGTGEELPWDRLILATGSESFVPAIGGWGTPGTFVLRSADDALQVRAFAQLNGAKRAVVAGGGLLGLEAAYALLKLGLQTTVLERSERLLRRQLDERAGELLTRYLEGLGLTIWTRAETAEVAHNGRLGEVVLKDARSAPADVLIAAAGIAPNVDLAKNAGLETGRGVVVDEHMRTSDERIFAAGDVAEFGGQVSGLWPAAVDQARVAAEAAVLKETSPYQGTVPVTVLKVVGVDLTSIGEIEPRSPDDEVIVEEDENVLRYGKLIISEGQIIGAILLGYSKEVAYVTSAVKQGWDVTPALNALREGRWDVLERLGRGRSLSSVSVVGVGG